MLDMPASAALFATSFVAGLASSVHCIGMCGGAVAAMVMLPAGSSSSSSSCRTASGTASQSLKRIPVTSVTATTELQAVKRSLAFNIGRIVTYTLMGIALGAAGAAGARVLIVDAASARLMLFVVAQLALAAVGLHLIFGLGWLQYLEQRAAPLWQHLAPLARAQLRARAGQAVLLGLLWGWIPCGLVYAMLISAAAAGGAAAGGFTMLAFGLGTLPAMFCAGVGGGALRRRLAAPRARAFIGLAVLMIALWGIARTPMIAGQSAFGALASLCDEAARGLAFVAAGRP
jgi:uncharacterized protein